MPSIVIRLHSDKAVDPNVFGSYLQNLQIQAFDLSFGNPNSGNAVGQATFFSATVNPLFFLQGPPNFGPNAGANTGIVQHYEVTLTPKPPFFTYTPVALATAVIQVPATGYENLRLEVTRGTEQIDPGGEFYNVAVDPNLFTPD